MRFPTHKAGRGGWTEWIPPKPDSYFMKCCDCGLVHEMQFRTFIRKGRSKAVILPAIIQTMFRVRRARP